jgi:hypothetical protein
MLLVFKHAKKIHVLLLLQDFMSIFSPATTPVEIHCAPESGNFQNIQANKKVQISW